MTPAAHVVNIETVCNSDEYIILIEYINSYEMSYLTLLHISIIFSRLHAEVPLSAKSRCPKFNGDRLLNFFFIENLGIARRRIMTNGFQ